MVATVQMFNNTTDYRNLLNMLLQHGDPVSPRGQTCLEMRNVVIELPTPVDVLAVGCGRNFNSKLAAYESLALIAGVSYPAKAIKVAPALADFTNEEGTFDGAYGPRLAVQLEYVIAKLQEDPHTRQACAVMWRSWDLSVPTKDLPCTVYLNFAIRDETLTLTTHMRSQDAWWGWAYDVVQFTQLQWTIANVLGVRVGPYVHVLDSLHVYARNTEDIYKFLRYDNDRTDREMLTGIGTGDKMSWNEAKLRALTMLDQEYGKDSDVAVNDLDHWFFRQGLRYV
jgi:hypothetical protein